MTSCTRILLILGVSLIFYISEISLLIFIKQRHEETKLPLILSLHREIDSLHPCASLSLSQEQGAAAARRKNTASPPHAAAARVD
jgi:hypothetical protein